MLALQSRAIDQCTKAVKADKAGEGRLALYYYKGSLSQLMEWLTLEKEAGAREALKSRIRGYMMRAEELKDVLAAAAAAASACEESGTATTMRDTLSKGANTDSRSKNDNNTIKGAGEKSSSDSCCGSNRTFSAAATTIVSTEVGPQQDGSNAHTQEEEGGTKNDTDISHHRVEDTPLVALHDFDSIPSCLHAPCEKELREREAWLREWEAALVAKDLELQRRVKEMSRMERRVEAVEKEMQDEDECKKDSTEKEVEDVESGETAVEGKPGKDT